MGFYFLSQATCALLLIISAVAKLRAPDATRSAFDALRVPQFLPRTWGPGLLPWVELALAVAVVVLTPGRGLEVAAVALLVLFACYTALIARALSFGEPVRCGCFGELGNDSVSVTTLVRNLGLVALALLVLCGPSTPASWHSGWLWAATGALCTAVAMLSLWRSGASQHTDASGATLWLSRARFLDVKAGQEVLLRDAAGKSGATLLFVMPGCGSCEQVLAGLRGTDTSRIIVVGPTGSAAEAKFAEVARFYEDPGFNIANALGADVIPAALAIDSNGRPIGELVTGADEVLASLLNSVEDAAPFSSLEEAPNSVQESQEQDSSRSEDALSDDDIAEYVRAPIPASIVMTHDGKPKTLRELSAAKAQLLIGVNCLCSTPTEAIAAIPFWQEKFDVLEVRLITPFEIGERIGSEEVRQQSLYDHAGITSKALELHGQVSAVLLGADGLLAGGPVYGIEEVREFIEEIEEQLALGG